MVHAQHPHHSDIGESTCETVRVTQLWRWKKSEAVTLGVLDGLDLGPVPHPHQAHGLDGAVLVLISSFIVLEETFW